MYDELSGCLGDPLLQWMEDIYESLAARAMSEGSDIPTALVQLVGRCGLEEYLVFV